MMTTPIPKNCLDEIQRMQRGFIWGDTDEKRRMHLINWDTLILPRECGGLAIRDLKTMNQACLTKLAWELRKGSEKLCFKVLDGKYGRGKLMSGEFTVKATDSKLWKELKKCWNFVCANDAWALGNGQSINLWNDRWIDGETKLSDVVTVIPPDSLNWKVSALLNNDGTWNSNTIHGIVPANMAARIEALPVGFADIPDGVYWPGNAHGNYSVAAGYARLRGDVSEWRDVIWAKVWKLQVPERVRCFVWQIMHGKLATKEFCSRWHAGSTTCHRCNATESFAHVLRDCPLASHLWNKLVPVSLQASFYGIDIYDWLEVNVSNNSCVHQPLLWCNIWAIGCYFLWWWRNKHEHDDHFIRPENTADFVLSYVRVYDEGIAASSVVTGTRRREEEIKWKPSSTQGVVLNTDGAWKSGSGIAGCGGVIRSLAGVWLGGFSKRLHVASSFLGELWGVLEGLRYVDSLGYSVVELQTDAREVVDVLCHNAVGHATGRHVVAEIRRLLGVFEAVRIIHIYREANRVADGLANLACTLDEGLSTFHTPPSCVVPLLSDDVSGVSTPRLTLV